MQIMGKISKAVIPAAGLGTRFLPATKAMPKEMLPVVDKPAIQYVVEEAVSSGLNHVLMITGRNKNALENHFDRAFELETMLELKGKEKLLAQVEAATELADIHYVRQGDARGLGHAISKAKTFVGDEAFAVLLGDDLIGENETLIPRMLKLAETREATVLALMRVQPSEVHKYGVVRYEGTHEQGIVKITGLVEKPRAEDAPSELAVIGRYVLQPNIFPAIEVVSEDENREIQLTDALNQIASENDSNVLGIVFEGDRYDTGDKLSYLKAIVQLATKRKDLGDEFILWLSEYLQTLQKK